MKEVMTHTNSEELVHRHETVVLSKDCPPKDLPTVIAENFRQLSPRSHVYQVIHIYFARTLAI